MLITFKCRAAPDVVMLENLAQYLVGIVGKHLGARGVITHEELPEAISKLEAAIVTDKREIAEHEGHFHEGEEGHETHELPIGLVKREIAEHEGPFHEGEEGHETHELPIGLAQRAYPFLDMLREAHRENADVLWGV